MPACNRARGLEIAAAVGRNPSDECTRRIAGLDVVALIEPRASLAGLARIIVG